MKKRRLVKGKDWHQWAWKWADENNVDYEGQMYSLKPNWHRVRHYKQGVRGKWVMVKFLEVEE